MFSRRLLAIGSRGCWRVFPTVCLIAALTSVAWADARFSLEGQLNLGTDQMDIPFNLSAQTEIIYSPLGFRTWSHSGGTNSAGEVIPAGGFDPTLTLLNGAATPIAYVDDGTGIESNYDSLLNFYGGTPAIPSPLAAGNYTLRLEPESDNFSSRTKNWAVDLEGPDNVLSLVLTTIDLVPGSAGISKVAVTGSGSKWTNSAELYYVGFSGTGSLLVKAGGQVNNAHGDIGYTATANGGVAVTGPGSLWNNSSAFVGARGKGQLTLSDGGRVNNTAGTIGALAGADGRVTVAGSGSVWTNSQDLSIGGTASAAGGSGELSVKDSGLVEVAGALKIWNTGTVTLDGGSLWVGSIDAESLARIDFKVGTFIVTSGDLSVGIPGQLSETFFPKELNVNVFNLATVPADGTLVVFGGFSSGGLTNLGTTLFVNTAIRGPVNNSTGSAINVVGNVVFTGLVSGGGGIFGSGTADFQGGVSPGASPARVNIEGSANFATSNTLFVELGGLVTSAEFDVLEIGGQADLGGTLEPATVVMLVLGMLALRYPRRAAVPRSR